MLIVGLCEWIFGLLCVGHFALCTIDRFLDTSFSFSVPKFPSFSCQGSFFLSQFVLRCARGLFACIENPS